MDESVAAGAPPVRFRAVPGSGGHLFSLLVMCFGVNGPRPVVVRSPGDIRQSTDAFRRRVRCGSRCAARSRSGRGVGRCASGPARVRQRGGLVHSMAAARLDRWRNAPVVAVSGLSLRKGKVGVGWRGAERLLSGRRAAQAGRGRPLPSALGGCPPRAVAQRPGGRSFRVSSLNARESGGKVDRVGLARTGELL